MAEPWKIETVRAALPLGTRVRKRPLRHRVGGYDGEKRPYWVAVDAEGVVVDYIAGYPEHGCPDHHRAPECSCGGESGRIRASEAVAVVAWSTSYEDGSPGPPHRSCIELGQRGETWELDPQRPAGKPTAAQRRLLGFAASSPIDLHGEIELSLEVGCAGAALHAVRAACLRRAWIDAEGGITDAGRQALQRSEASS